MPDRMHMLDTGYPNFSGYEKTSEKVDAIQNYLFMLLEELRFLLRNLDLDNFNEQGIKDLATEAAKLVDVPEGSGTVIADLVISNSIIANELYANYGEIADLTVWRLRTDYMRARNYLNGTTADINYIDIHDEQIDFITASVTDDPPRSTQLVRDGLYFYWADAEKSRMTCVEETPWPVMVYVYSEMTKLSIKFQTITLTNGTTTYAPVITLGAGDENGRSKGFIFKRQNDLLLRYLTSAGEYTDVSLNDFVDAKHRRLASCEIDRSRGILLYTMEGDSETHMLTFTEGTGAVTFRWPDGHTCVVSISGGGA